MAAVPAALRRLALVAGLTVACPLAALAAETGMPQLQFANVLTRSQVVWGAIIFTGLYFILARRALPRVAGVLAARARAIEGDLEAARRAKVEADEAVAELTAAIRLAHVEAQAAIAGAMAAAKAEAEVRAAALGAALDARLAAAEAEIGASRAAALMAVRDVAAETAAAMLARLTGRVPDPGVLEGALAAAQTPG